MRRYRRINPRPLCSKTHKPHMLITQFSMLITVLNHVNHCLGHAINGHYPLTKLPAGKAETFHALFRSDWRLNNRPDRSPNHPLSNPHPQQPLNLPLPSLEVALPVPQGCPKPSSPASSCPSLALPWHRQISLRPPTARPRWG